MAPLGHPARRSTPGGAKHVDDPPRLGRAARRPDGGSLHLSLVSPDPRGRRRRTSCPPSEQPQESTVVLQRPPSAPRTSAAPSPSAASSAASTCRCARRGRRTATTARRASPAGTSTTTARGPRRRVPRPDGADRHLRPRRRRVGAHPPLHGLRRAQRQPHRRRRQPAAAGPHGRQAPGPAALPPRGPARASSDARATADRGHRYGGPDGRAPRFRYSKWDGTQVGFDLDADVDPRGDHRRPPLPRRPPRGPAPPDAAGLPRPQRRAGHGHARPAGAAAPPPARPARALRPRRRLRGDRRGAPRGGRHGARGPRRARRGGPRVAATSAARRSPTRSSPSATSSSTCCRPTWPGWCSELQQYEFTSQRGPRAVRRADGPAPPGAGAELLQPDVRGHAGR